jgi:hypothetical protein
MLPRGDVRTWPTTKTVVGRPLVTHNEAILNLFGPDHSVIAHIADTIGLIVICWAIIPIIIHHFLTLIPLSGVMCFHHHVIKMSRVVSGTK